MESILEFLTDLTENNDREWFNENKSRYQEVKTLFDGLVESVILELQKHDTSLKGASAKNSVYRIYRDVRFSEDKSPYKTHLGAYMVGGGRKSGRSGYYMHLDPAGSFLGAGVYQPESSKLKMIRKEIYNFPEDFEKILKRPDFSKSFKLYDKDKLKRPPKGYSEEFEFIDFLKYRHYIASTDIPIAWIGNKRLVTNLVDKFQTLTPLNNFLNRAMESEDHS